MIYCSLSGSSLPRKLPALMIHLRLILPGSFGPIFNIGVSGFLVFAPAWALSQAQERRPAATPNQTVNTSERLTSDLRDAVALLSAGRPAEAEPIIRSVIARSPGNADAHNLLGIVLDQRGKTPEAEREYRVAIRLNPNGVSALANLGVLLARS